MYHKLFFNYILPMINFVSKSYESIIKEATFCIDNIQKGYNSDILIFYDKNPSAYIYSYIHKNNDAIITWKFSRYYNTFFNYNCLYNDVKRFPIITSTIEEICEDSTKKIIVCLDDFFNELRVERSNIGFPTLQQVLEIYTYTNGLVLDRNKTYLMKYLDDNLDEHILNIFSDNFNFS